jgi:hemolysin-activating ACP:hemolysin acyltransferase
MQGLTLPARCHDIGRLQEKGIRSMAAKSAKTDTSDAASAAKPQVASSGPEGGKTEDPELQRKLAELRTNLRDSIGNIIIAMMALPRYQEQTLGDLKHLVVEPMLNDRIALAYASQQPAKDQPLAGIAIWASVSEEVDARIREQIRQGVFPIRLKPEDWTSGSINWLFDVIAADRAMTARVIGNFSQLVKDGGLRLHPLINRLVDNETLRKMGAERIGGTA